MTDYRQIQKTNFTSITDLSEYLKLSDENRKLLFNRPRFVLNLPRRLAAKIRQNDLNDPIFRQFVPLGEESVITPGFLKDPVGDKASQCSSKLLQKYQGRALLVTTSACAMHCRYCFRQNYPYDSAQKSYALELDLIAKDPSIHEIILSGGDPLSLSNDRLATLIESLEQISHLRRLRIHTRFPIGIPERVDAGFLEILKKCTLQCFFVIHTNHKNELDADVFAALKKIQNLGIPVMNQAVLLKGVNDEENTLKELFEALVNEGILAYYLHQLDRVQGAFHFEVEESRGLQLIRYLERTLPGYAVPKYVREIAGEPSKTPLHFI